MNRVPSHPLAAVMLAAGLLAVPAPGGAQQVVVPDRPAPVSVPSDHWVYPLLDRMAADGLLAGAWLPGRRPADARAVGAALDTAAARSAGDSDWHATATAARGWFRSEYGAGSGGRLRVVPTTGVALGDGPRTDPSALSVGVEARYRPGADLGLWAEPVVEVRSGGVELPVPRLGGAWRAGPVRVSGSWEAHRLGPAASGGIVLHDRAELGWLQVALEEPVVLPWLLRWLGPFQASVSGSGIGADSLGSRVAVFAGELRFQPHPRVTLGVYRTAVIATEVDGEALDLGNLIASMLGTRSGTTANFDDQKLSFSGSLRGDLLGVTVMPYFVWGIEDTWEIDRDPAAVLGAWLPALPVGRPLGLRYEYTAFGDEGRIIWPWAESWEWRNWYRHGTGRTLYVNGDGELLGHPLGGYGTEHRVEVALPLPERGALVRAGLFTRHRDRGLYEPPSGTPGASRPYGNILYDELPGRSGGGSVRASLSRSRLRLDGALTVEVGDAGWSRVAGSLRARWLLP